jgi:4-hydroxy-2-oxoheptanedioate aldolase
MTHLSEAILKGTRGIRILSTDPWVVSALRNRVDFLVIDAAARAFSPEALTGLIAAAGETPVFIRTEDSAPVTLQRYLTFGVDGLILTGVQYAAEAEKAVAACLYPPEGVRGFAPNAFASFAAVNDIGLQAANDQQTAAQIDEIADVTGIDGLLLTPRKMAVAMERGFDVNHADVLQALQTAVTAADSYELYWGWEGEFLPEKIPAFHVLCSDMDLLARGLEQYLPMTIVDDNEDESEASLRAVR